MLGRSFIVLIPPSTALQGPVSLLRLQHILNINNKGKLLKRFLSIKKNISEPLFKNMNSRWLFLSQHNTFQGVSVSYITEIMGENDEVFRGKEGILRAEISTSVTSFMDHYIS